MHIDGEKITMIRRHALLCVNGDVNAYDEKTLNGEYTQMNSLPLKRILLVCQI